MGDGRSEMTSGTEAFECCGLPMVYQDIFNIRRYECMHRPHHPVIYVNRATGEALLDENGYGPSVIPVHSQGDEEQDR